jgi:hypothetical protein
VAGENHDGSSNAINETFSAREVGGWVKVVESVRLVAA